MNDRGDGAFGGHCCGRMFEHLDGEVAIEYDSAFREYGVLVLEAIR